MKPLTRQSYSRRIERAVDLLAARLADSNADAMPSNEELAAAASMSPFHFQRIYRLMTGETPARTHQRLRLLRALREIDTPNATVTKAAMAAGYSSSQALAKSLKSYRGTTMTELKNDRRKLAAEIANLSRPGRLESGPPPPLQIAVEDLDSFGVIALRNIGPYEDLANGYGRLFACEPIARNLEHLVGIYGIPYDDRRFDPPASARFDCCVALDRPVDVPTGLRPLELGGGPHLRVRHQGAYPGLEALTDAAYEALMSSDALHEWSFADRPVFHHYLNDPDETAEPDLLTDILIPLRRDATDGTLAERDDDD